MSSCYRARFIDCTTPLACACACPLAGVSLTAQLTGDCCSFFVVTCYAPTSVGEVHFDATVVGKHKGLADEVLGYETNKKGKGSLLPAPGAKREHSLQLMQVTV